MKTRAAKSSGWFQRLVRVLAGWVDRLPDEIKFLIALDIAFKIVFATVFWAKLIAAIAQQKAP